MSDRLPSGFNEMPSQDDIFYSGLQAGRKESAARIAELEAVFQKYVDCYPAWHKPELYREMLAALKGGSNALSIEDPLVEAALKGGAL